MNNEEMLKAAGIILARYARYALSEIDRLREEKERLKSQLDDAVNTLEWYVCSKCLEYQGDGGVRAFETLKDLGGKWKCKNCRLIFPMYITKGWECPDCGCAFFAYELDKGGLWK